MPTTSNGFPDEPRTSRATVSSSSTTTITTVTSGAQYPENREWTNNGMSAESTTPWPHNGTLPEPIARR